MAPEWRKAPWTKIFAIAMFPTVFAVFFASHEPKMVGVSVLTSAMGFACMVDIYSEKYQTLSLPSWFTAVYSTIVLLAIFAVVQIP